jgi:gamma-glutamylcyclotransferase (GGCT)/AIG2-like uncharacterized protein YtfP
MIKLVLTMAHIFVYGTLMFEKILKKITGKQFTSKPVTLSGYKRFAVKNKPYPAIVPIEDAESKVEGKLLLNVDEESLKKLSEYEGEEFEQKKVTVKYIEGELDAVAFIWKSDSERLEGKWDPGVFGRENLNEYLQE